MLASPPPSSLATFGMTHAVRLPLFLIVVTVALAGIAQEQPKTAMTAADPTPGQKLAALGSLKADLKLENGWTVTRIERMGSKVAVTVSGKPGEATFLMPGSERAPFTAGTTKFFYQRSTLEQDQLTAAAAALSTALVNAAGKGDVKKMVEQIVGPNAATDSTDVPQPSVELSPGKSVAPGAATALFRRMTGDWTVSTADGSSGSSKRSLSSDEMILEDHAKLQGDHGGEALMLIGYTENGGSFWCLLSARSKEHRGTFYGLGQYDAATKTFTFRQNNQDGSSSTLSVAVPGDDANTVIAGTVGGADTGRFMYKRAAK